MPFRQLSLIVSLISLTLCVALVLRPEIVYWVFGIQGNTLGNFLAKRAGVLFLGFSILCFLSRNTNSKELIRIVAVSIGVAMGAMAMLGIYELARGTVGMGILAAVIVESIIAILFYRLWRDNRPF